MRDRGTVLILVAALLAAALGVGVQRMLGAHPGGGFRAGSTLAPMTLPDRQGRPVTLPTPGRALLLNYWASWCEPCRRELPLLGGFAHRHWANGPQVVGIALDEAGPVTAFLARTPVDYPILLEARGPNDSSVRLGDDRGMLPYSVLVAADGRVLARRLGPFRDAADLEAWAQSTR